MAKPAQPTIYAALVFPRDDAGETALVVWRADLGRVEVRGTLDVDENDPLQRVIDSFPGWFVSGLMSADDGIVAVSPWEHYTGSYNILLRLLHEAGNDNGTAHGA